MNNLPLVGPQHAVMLSTDREFQMIALDYVMAMDFLVEGDTKSAALCGLSLLETLLNVETRIDGNLDLLDL